MSTTHPLPSETAKPSSRNSWLPGLAGLTIAQKLTLGFGLVFAFIVIISVTAFISLWRVNNAVVQLVEQVEPLGEVVLSMETSTQQLIAETLAYVVDREPEHRAQVLDINQNIVALVAEFDRLVQTDEQRELGKEIANLLVILRVYSSELVDVTNQQITKLQTLREKIVEIDALIDDQIQTAIDRDAPNAILKLETALDMEININEAYAALERDPISPLIFNDAIQDYERFEAIYRNSQLSANEELWLQQLNTDFSQVQQLGNDLILLEERKQRSLAQLDESASSIDIIFNDQLQPLIQTEIVRVENSTNQIARLASLVTLILTIVAIVTGGGAAFTIYRAVANPIRNLMTASEQMKEGNLDSQVPVEADDELGRLALSFNSMSAQVRQMVELQARTNELTISMEVGQRAAAIRSLDELLSTITELIRERFELYYTHVYLADDLDQNLVIKAGTGQVGQELLARRHTLPIGSGSIVGQVAASGQSIVVSDTQVSELHKPNPLLPKTRSEVAVPLLVGGKVIGVLDMQSDQVDTFTDKNLAVFEAMAIQLAISVDSAQQWAAGQEAQKQADMALERLTTESWTETLIGHREVPAFSYDLSVVTPLQLETQNGNDYEAVPVAVQNTAIGQLSVKKPEDRALTYEEQALMSAVAQQLAQKAENLRLFEQTQQRAAREQIARQITDKIRASKDIETALKTAAVELSKALGTARATVDLQVRQSQADSDKNNNK